MLVSVAPAFGILVSTQAAVCFHSMHGSHIYDSTSHYYDNTASIYTLHICNGTANCVQISITKARVCYKK